MGISVVVNNDSTELTIHVTNSFVFSVQREFRQAYERCPATTKHIYINIACVEYIDSSAIGMLLVANEYTKAKNIKIEIINCSEYVQKVLDIARLHEEISIAPASRYVGQN